MDTAGASLELADLVIKDDKVRISDLFEVGNNCRLTLGKGVSVVTKGRNTNKAFAYIEVGRGATLVVDGATFSCETGSFGSWINVGTSGSADLVLKSFSFGGADDYIYVMSSGYITNISMVPGIATTVPLCGIFFTENFAVTSTGGNFTAADVAKLSLLPDETWIDASGIVDPNGDDYEVLSLIHI